MATSGVQPRRGPTEVRRITAVVLIAGTEQASFPVGPKPFVYREGMRLRIDILGDRAFVAEVG